MQTIKKIPSISLKEYLPFFKNFLQFVETKVIKYPKAFRVKMITHNLVFIHDPLLIKHVLLDNPKNYIKGYQPSKIVLGEGLIMSEGKEWLEKRRFIQPFFKAEQLNNYVRIFSDTTRSYMNQLKSEELLHFTTEISHIVVNILGKSLLGANISPNKAAEIRACLAIIGRVGYFVFLSPIRIPNWVASIPILTKQTNALKKLKKIVEQIKIESLAQKEASNNFIQTLKKGYTDDQLKDEIMNFLITGQETIIPSLAWCFYTIATNYAVKIALQKEVDTYGVPNEWVPESVYKYKLVLSFLSEILRLYPPAYVFSRQAMDNDVNNGYLIQKNDYIVMNVYGMHRHPQFWVNPYTLDLNRFEKLDHKGIQKCQYLPFGLGNRICVAQNYAIQEMAIIVIELMAQFEVYLPDQTKYEPNAAFTLGLDKPLLLRLKRRNN